MADDYSKSLDTEIQELQVKDKRSDKFILLCFGMMVFGTIILELINFIFQIPIIEKAAMYWPVFWIAVCIIAVIKRLKSDKNLRSKMAKKIGIDDILNQYLEVEIFDPERAVDKEIMRAAGMHTLAGGNNYIKGRINGCSIETSYVDISVNDDLGGGQDHWYTGQLSFLKNKCCFSGKLLLVRTGDYSKYGIGRIYYENLVSLPKYSFQPAKSFIDSLKDRDRKQHRILIPDVQLGSQWEVFSSDPEMARRLLDPHTELYRRLLNSPRLAFVLYSDDNIYFGGKYYFDLTKGTPEEARANVEEAMDGLIKEGVGTVLSAEYPAEGGSGGI